MVDNLFLLMSRPGRLLPKSEPIFPDVAALPPSRLRRSVDVAVVSAVLIVSWPLLLALALAVRLSTGGNAILKQERVGEAGVPFVCFKFRGMRPEAGAPELDGGEGPQIPTLGRILQATGLDGLPQLLNVLRGDMTLVGPQPESIELARRYPPHLREIFAYRPGLTGPAQVRMRDNLPSGPVDTELRCFSRVTLDLEYLDDPSLGRTVGMVAEAVDQLVDDARVWLLQEFLRHRARTASTTRVSAARRHARAGVALRVFLVVALCIGAYHYSLATLFNGSGLGTPLTYPGLVPVIAVVLAIAKARPADGEPDIHDRYLDYIVGVALLVTALTGLLALPIQLSSYFWLWRLDLLSLPLFAAGAVALCFGARALWRLRGPIAFLALTWALPFVLLVHGGLQFLTEATLQALRHILAVIPLAVAATDGNGSVFSIPHGGHSFTVSLDSATAGATAVLGFLLLGSAFALLVRGRPAARVGWLLAGLATTWTLNLVRILLLFACGRTWGEPVARAGLHPYVGLLVSAIGLLAMVSILPAFRLRFRQAAASRPADRARAWRTAGSAGLAVTKGGLAITLLLLASTVAGLANQNLQQFGLLGQPLGQPVLQQSSLTSSPIAGWTVRKIEDYPWISTYLGSGASWTRYEYLPEGQQPAGTPPDAASTITLDLLTTSNLPALASYGVENAYHFHRYELVETGYVDLGAGVIGHSATYRNRSLPSSTWTAVSWDWPVQTATGVAYERVVLNMRNRSTAELAAPAIARGPVDRLRAPVVTTLGGSDFQALRVDEATNREFLVRFGQLVVLSSARRDK